MTSNYTGPVTIVTFQSTVNPNDRFGLTFHTAVEDLDSIDTIVKRYAEDGYQPDLSSVRRWYMIDGQLEERTPKLHSLGYRARSAFLRA